jgi:hypothetical protein
MATIEALWGLCKKRERLVCELLDFSTAWAVESH